LNFSSNATDVTKVILEVIHEKKPQSVKQLIRMLKERLNLTEEELIDSLIRLQVEGVVNFENQALTSKGLTSYLKTDEAIWYWMSIAAEAFVSVLVFSIL
jgi:DNA-binding Lrp family transcriptional regulator